MSRSEGFTPHNKISWSDVDIRFLKNNHIRLTNVELSNSLGIKLTSVRTKLYELGLYKMRLEYWNEEQVSFLKDHYKIMGDTELAEIFNAKWNKNKGWSKKHIEKKRRYLKLKRNAEEKFEIKERNRIQGRFSINHWKRWINTKSPVGTIRTWFQDKRGTKYIKLDGGFVNYARHLYNQQIGPIPKGFVIRFKDGNSLNCELNNLELISMEENAKRNSIQRLPPNLRRAIYDLSKLKRKIKNHEKQD